MSIHIESFRKVSYFETEPISTERKFHHVHFGLAKVSLCLRWGDFILWYSDLGKLGYRTTIQVLQGLFSSQLLWIPRLRRSSAGPHPELGEEARDHTLGCSITITLTEAADLYWALSARFCRYRESKTAALRATPCGQRAHGSSVGWWGLLLSWVLKDGWIWERVWLHRVKAVAVWIHTPSAQHCTYWQLPMLCDVWGVKNRELS